MSEKLELVTNYVSNMMNSALRYFAPGSKITVIVRLPEDDEADFVLTNDELAEVGRVVDRRTAAAAMGKGQAYV